MNGMFYSGKYAKNARCWVVWGVCSQLPKEKTKKKNVAYPEEVNRV
jgi:hypothetical protein